MSEFENTVSQTEETPDLEPIQSAETAGENVPKANPASKNALTEPIDAGNKNTAK